MSTPVHVVVLAAGEGKRLGGAHPKVLTPLWGRPSVAWVARAVRPLAPARTVVVGGAHLEALGRALADEGVELAEQREPRGTGDAVLAARDALAGVSGPLLILYGDCPLLRPELLERLLAVHTERGAALSLLTLDLPDPTGYGRILRDDAGAPVAIVEERDASPAQRALTEVNAGVWVVELPSAFERLARVGSQNAQGEVYLTDLLGLAVEAGETVASLAWDEPEDALGFNDQAELALARDILRDRILLGHLEAGVEIVDPATTFIDAEVTIEPGARILPCTMIEGRVSIGAGCEVGPFTHLRNGTVLEPGAEVGNFTETKQSRLGAGSKAKHLTYLGDAVIGPRTNIGAGTITANYDGKAKHRTVIGSRAFIGSGTVIVAPSTVRDGATTGAGAVVTRNSEVGEGETWVGVPARPLARPSRPAEDPDRDEPR